METPPNPAAILLTGPKHAGKTAAGKALAARQGGSLFTDLDQLIEERAGKSPRALFKEGPGIFRTAEAEALESLLRTLREDPARSPRIIAAGGGLIDNPAALDLLKNFPPVTIVYLEVSAETAWERISRAARESGELPPFLDTADPRSAHRRLHTGRARRYRRLARHTLQAEGKTPDQLARELQTLLNLAAPLIKE